ncbi:hypothetical protein GCM10010315_53090 [Streptomyces luteosporeus]|uniref:DUF397 domain-containing protein n=1 Tax=Streptomyces luteosporeus TaxID=173856 RepID=A0ABN3U4T9_9ACTN
MSMSLRPRYAQPRYVHSSHSTGMNNCVETALLGPGLLAVRDSKRASGPVLLFSRAAWSAFVVSLRAPACRPPARRTAPAGGAPRGARRRPGDRGGRRRHLAVGQVRAGGQPQP